MFLSLAYTKGVSVLGMILVDVYTAETHLIVIVYLCINDVVMLYLCAFRLLVCLWDLYKGVSFLGLIAA